MADPANRGGRRGAEAMAAGGRRERRARRLMSAADVKAVDAQAERDGAAPSALMQAAGDGAAAVALARYADRPGPVVVLAGPGANGGDGYVIAAALRAAGREVLVFALDGAAETLSDSAPENGAETKAPGPPSPAQAAREAWIAQGGAVVAVETGLEMDPRVLNAAFLVDALFGVGLNRPMADGPAALARQLAFIDGPPIFSVDIPSGVSADTGQVVGGDDGAAFAADATATFVRPKRGHCLAAGALLTGALDVIDILTPCGAESAVDAASADVFEIRGETLGRALGKRRLDAHKFVYGHLVAVSGGLGASGAARLAARGALRVGAGLVTVAAPEAAMPECAAQLTAVMLRQAEEPDALAALLDDARLNAVVLGPGHSAHEGGRPRTRAFVEALTDGAPFRRGERTLAFDADALTCWGGAPEDLFELLSGDGAPAKTVLTPHFGEFATLFPDLASPLLARRGEGAGRFGRIEAARLAAERSGAVVVLKGVDTVVAAPSGLVGVHAAVRERAAPWLATAGSGDVLVGLIAGLAAQGWDPFDAACAGVWLHVSAARRAGPGLIAEDLPEAVAVVLAAAASAGPER